MKNSFYFLGMFNIFPITIRNIFINKFNNLINIINASTKCVEGFVNNCNNLLSYYHTVKLDSVAQQAPQESPLVQVQRRASMFSMIKRIITQTKMKNSFYFLGMFNIFHITIRNLFYVLQLDQKQVKNDFDNDSLNILIYYPIVPLYSAPQSGTPIMVFLLFLLRTKVILKAYVYTKEGRDIIILTIIPDNKQLDNARKLIRAYVSNEGKRIFIFTIIPEDLDNGGRFRGEGCVIFTNQKSAFPDCSLKQSLPNKNMSNSLFVNITITQATMKNSIFSFPFPFPVIFGLLFLWATTSYYGSFIRFPGLQSRAYSFPKVCMWEIDPATRDCRPICKIGWDIVLIKTC